MSPETETKPAAARALRHTTVLERQLDATPAEVWELLTTAAGFETWWGPEGFETEVRTLELKPGGLLHYAMKATGAEQVAFMKRAGMPLVNETRSRFLEVVPERLLRLEHLVDFVPGLEPYAAETRVELQPSGAGVRMVVTLEAMHDAHWTQMAVMGWESQFGKLVRALAA